LAVSVLAGILLALVLGIAVVVFRTDQVLTGLIVFAMGLGLTGAIGRPFAHKPIAGYEKLDMGALTEIPWLGPLLFGQDMLVYLTAILVIVLWYGIYRTQIGLRLRAVGEDPATADAAGVNVAVYRLGAILAGGALCGLSGGYLALASGQIWVEGMTAGRGWIAVALAIFARWRPGRAVVGAIIFGGTEAIIPRVQATGADIPAYFLLMLPYLLTLVVLIVPAIMIRGREDDAPSALMTNYVREDRP
jgi:simple sugar transport system permease protein